ncbi:MAG TPA: biotin/lipoyl-containing protein, partial [Flavisolibacter sp.]|nr:biotin/lipoyl-containing protein [Flavisolibacter sp.]
MATVDLVMPKMGESIMEATILKWHKAPGDAVKMDETLLEIATDKVDTEVPCTAEGVLEEMLFSVNDVVPIGTVIARIRTGESNQQPATTNRQQEPAPAQPAPQPTVAAKQETGNDTPNPNPPNQARFYSPLVLNIAAQEGVSMTELEAMPGTGAEGRVSKRDILQFVTEKRAGKAKSSSMEIQTPKQEERTQKEEPKEMMIPMNKVEQKGEPQEVNQVGAYTGNVEIIEMDRMRKLIADHMVRSKHTSPHVTSFTEADVTNLVMWREKVKKEFEKREGAKITFTPLFIEAVV